METETNASGSSADRARLEERLDAVERALTGTDRSVASVVDGAAADAEREAIATRLDAVETRIEELEAATQAVRGYAGAIRAVNREVERRADLALARATAARHGASEGEPTEGDRTAKRDGFHTDRADGAKEIPSDDALDAAIPDEPIVGGANDGTGGANDGTSEANDGSGEANDGSDGHTNPLERLREAL